MRLIFKPIFEWLIGNYSLFDDPMKNFITMGAIGLIALTIAWFSVKAMYNGGDIKK
jgi:plastocyanin domain-containing protein